MGRGLGQADMPPLHPAGHGCPLAGWSLLAGGMISSAAAALIVVGGGLAAGNILVAAVAVPGGVLAVAAAVAAVHRPRMRGALERPGARQPLVEGCGSSPTQASPAGRGRCDMAFLAAAQITAVPITQPAAT